MIKNVNDFLSLAVMIATVIMTAGLFIGSISRHEAKTNKGMTNFFKELSNYPDNIEE